MEREVSDMNILADFCTQFCDIVEKHCKYIVVSGFVAIASGRTRGTEDIDMIIQRVDKDTWSLLCNDLTKAGFVCMQSDNPQTVYEYLDDNTSVRFTWKEKPLPEMEVKFSKDALDEYQIKNRVKLELTGLNVWFSNVNVNIAFKEQLLKSPKDMEDANHLRIVFEEKVDEKEIDEVAKLIKELRL